MAPVNGAYLYILRCADGSLYIGTTRKGLEQRIAEHNSGAFEGYTISRRPVVSAFAQHFDKITDAITAERQLKGWSRAKKEALIAGDWTRIKTLAKRRGSHPSRRRASHASSG